MEAPSKLEGNYLEIILNCRERFEASEILFNPAVAGIESLGTSEVVFKAINVRYFISGFPY